MKFAAISQMLSGILAKFPEINLVYLFGSRVSGQIGPMSDYDLAIFCSPLGEESRILPAFQHAISIALQTDKVDVVDLRRAPIELAYRIISDGELLYQADLATRVEFEAGVLTRYGDYLPVLRAFRDQILQGDGHDKRVQRYRDAIGRAQRPPGAPRSPAR